MKTFMEKCVDGEASVEEVDEYGANRMIRTKEWKYIHRYPYGPHELYYFFSLVSSFNSTLYVLDFSNTFISSYTNSIMLSCSFISA